MTKFTRGALWDIALPAFFLLAVTAVFRLTDLDMSIQKCFYRPDAEGGFNQYAQPWLFIYQYGNWPSVITAIAAGAILVVGFFYRPLSKHRRDAAFVLALLLVGPLLLVNVLFKDHWGRPRPRELLAFNPESDNPENRRAFLPVGVIGDSGRNSSFPSGHASGAFFMMFPYFLLRDKRKGWAAFFLALGLAYGALSGLGRVIQGGHFATDVIWAAGFVYFPGVILSYAFGARRGRRDDAAGPVPQEGERSA